MAKYAQAAKVEIVLSVGHGRVTLSVADDGIGGADVERGSGLTGLRDRLGAIGGNLVVSSSQGEGTTVVAVAPLT